MRNSFHRRPASKPPITGADRVGIQGDLSAVLDKARSETADPRVERPLVMIRSIRYVGDTEGATPAAAMAAKSHALYEFLMASARTQIATTEDHTVPFADVMAYLDTPRADRIREYIDAISKTYVSYDFTEEDGTRRAANRIQLLQCEEVMRPTGEREIGYRMHPSVRKVILAATQYAHLEVAAFARFRCKYSARLYPKLAYVAGLDERHPLVYKPEDLADELGWRGKKGVFHWGHFEADCLRPAMDDMFGAEDGSTEQKVRRFTANYELRRAATRGRPVESVIFHVGKAQRLLNEQQKPKVVSLDRERVRKIFTDAGLDHTETPNEELLAQAAGKLQIGISAVAERWSATIALAKSDPDVLIGSLGILTGKQILEIIAAEGIRAAVTKWLIDWKESKDISYRPGFVPAPKPQPQAIAAAPEPTLKPLSKTGISFDQATVIRIEFDDDIRTQRWAHQLVNDLDAQHYLAVDAEKDWAVGARKRLRLEWNGNGLDRYEVEVNLAEQMLRLIVNNYRQIIEEVEYLA